MITILTEADSAREEKNYYKNDKIATAAVATTMAAAHTHHLSPLLCKLRRVTCISHYVPAAAAAAESF